MLIVQVKHSLEQEVENMEKEIVQLKAQLEGDSDLEETNISGEENVAGDYALCKKVAMLIPEADEAVGSDQSAVRQGVVTDTVKEVLTTPENKDWPELSANTVKMCESVMMMLPHDTTVRQSASQNTFVMEDDGGRLLSAEETSADVFTATDAREAASLVGDYGCSMPAVLLVNVSGTGQMVNESCIQFGYAGGLDQETVSAVPDSLERTPAACDAANDRVEDDTDSYLSCEDIIIPDSEDDLYSSPHDEDIDHAVLASHPDESEHVSISDEVSLNNVHEQFENLSDYAQLVNMSDAHGSEMKHHVNVDSLAGCMKKEQCGSTEECSRKNGCNNMPSRKNHIGMSDACSDDTMKHKSNVHVNDLAEKSHLSGTDKHIDAASALHQQSTTLSVVYEQLPKRPHWTFVVSGINQALDQVISPTVHN